MLSIEEVRYPGQHQHSFITCSGLTGITWVDFHGLESLMWCKRGTSPLPDASQFTLTSKMLAIWGDWGRVPVFEPDVAVIEVKEHWHGARGSVLHWLVIRRAWVHHWIGLCVHTLRRSVRAVASTANISLW